MEIVRVGEHSGLDIEGRHSSRCDDGMARPGEVPSLFVRVEVDHTGDDLLVRVGQAGECDSLCCCTPDGDGPVAAQPLDEPTKLAPHLRFMVPECVSQGGDCGIAMRVRRFGLTSACF